MSLFLYMNCCEVTRVCLSHNSSAWTVYRVSYRATCIILVTTCHHFYLPRPFSPLFLSERGLFLAPESYLPLSARQRATQKLQGSKRCAYVLWENNCGKDWVFRDTSIAPRCCILQRGRMREREGWRHGGENAINMNIHCAWATRALHIN